MITLASFVESLKAPHIVGICGSNRVGSYNRMLLENAMAALEEQGASVEIIDLASLQLPLYDPAIESSDFPPAAKLLKEKLTAADGLIFTCPEFNGGITPLLCNSITWATRGEGGMYDGFKGKIATAMAASPGMLGGMRVVVNLQNLLQDMGCIIVNSHVNVGRAMTAFSEDGVLTEERAKSKLTTAVHQLVHFARFEANREADKLVEEILHNKNMGEYGEL